MRNPDRVLLLNCSDHVGILPMDYKCLGFSPPLCGLPCWLMIKFIFHACYFLFLHQFLLIAHGFILISMASNITVISRSVISKMILNILIRRRLLCRVTLGKAPSLDRQTAFQSIEGTESPSNRTDLRGASWEIWTILVIIELKGTFSTIFSILGLLWANAAISILGRIFTAMCAKHIFASNTAGPFSISFATDNYFSKGASALTRVR